MAVLFPEAWKTVFKIVGLAVIPNNERAGVRKSRSNLPDAKCLCGNGFLNICVCETERAALVAIDVERATRDSSWRDRRHMLERQKKIRDTCWRGRSCVQHERQMLMAR